MDEAVENIDDQFFSPPLTEILPIICAPELQQRIGSLCELLSIPGENHPTVDSIKNAIQTNLEEKYSKNQAALFMIVALAIDLQTKTSPEKTRLKLFLNYYLRIIKPPRKTSDPSKLDELRNMAESIVDKNYVDKNLDKLRYAILAEVRLPTF